MIKDKTGLYILGVIGVVALVGVFIMIVNSFNTAVEEDYVGMAGGTVSGKINISTTESCTDSDSGLTYTTKGYTVTKSSGIVRTTWDSCKTDKQVTEMSCSGTKAVSSYYMCNSMSDGTYSYGCIDGTCKTDVDLSIGGVVAKYNEASNEVEVHVAIVNKGSTSLKTEIEYGIQIGNILSEGTIDGKSAGTYLYPGESTIVSLTFKPTSDEIVALKDSNGYYSLNDVFVTLDYANKISETDETNNVVTLNEVYLYVGDTTKDYTEFAKADVQVSNLHIVDNSESSSDLYIGGAYGYYDESTNELEVYFNVLNSGMTSTAVNGYTVEIPGSTGGFVGSSDSTVLGTGDLVLLSNKGTISSGLVTTGYVNNVQVEVDTGSDVDETYESNNVIMFTSIPVTII
ncbi:MAG: CARDB domain-containing protein [Candidatus Woesearchaeota archaeon]|jgi:Tfp pilus assembly protein PilV